MSDESAPGLVPISEAARILGVSTSSLRRWEAAGRITPSRTPGGQRRYDVAALRALMNDSA